jgi:UDP-N-acetylglucosamine 2-epimerase
MEICDGIVGNSSSGITEAPILRKSSINIGLRQKGRPLSNSVIQVSANHKNISKAINKIFIQKFKNKFKNLKEHYFKKGTKFEIVKILKRTKLENIKLKEFID